MFIAILGAFSDISEKIAAQQEGEYLLGRAC